MATNGPNGPKGYAVTGPSGPSGGHLAISNNGSLSWGLGEIESDVDVKIKLPSGKDISMREISQKVEKMFDYLKNLGMCEKCELKLKCVTGVEGCELLK